MEEKAGGIAIILAVSQGLKAIGVPKKVLPLVNIVLGAIWGAITETGALPMKLINGAVIGAAAGGTYDVAHSTKKG